MRQREEIGDEAATTMKSKASVALKNLQSIKDKSIETFITNFASYLLSSEKCPGIRSVTDLNLDVCMSAINDTLLSSIPDQDFQTIKAVTSTLKDLEEQLYDSHEVQVYRKHFTGLIALNECVSNDKLASLPLLLRLTKEPCNL